MRTINGPSSSASEQQHATARAEAPARVVSEFEHLLSEAGCPACRYVAQAERSFFAWFEIESFSTPEMQAKLRAGVGMCPAHTRRLLASAGEGHVMTIVMREAIAGARECLIGDQLPGPCPACAAVEWASERVVHLLADSLSAHAHVRLYAGHTGICLPHLIRSAAVADPSVLKVLAERLRKSLVQTSGVAVIELLTGVDADAASRGRDRSALPTDVVGASTVEGLRERLALATCPICLACGDTDRRYLTWVVDQSHAPDSSLSSNPGELCAGHLSDLAQLDQPAAVAAAERKRAARQGELHQLLGSLSRLPAPTRRNRKALLVAVEGLRAQFTREPHCPACHARGQAETSQLALLEARSLRRGCESATGTATGYACGTR